MQQILEDEDVEYARAFDPRPTHLELRDYAQLSKEAREGVSNIYSCYSLFGKLNFEALTEDKLIIMERNT